MAKDDAEVKTKKQLLADMQKAMETGDFKAVSKVSSAIAKIVADEEKAEKDAKLSAIVGLTEQVKVHFDNLVVELNKNGALDACDGVWYSNDFGDKLTTCRLLKGATRKGGGGGGGKKFNITTNDLLTKHGAEQMGDSGMTFQQAYDEKTDGNSRYKVRMKLLKADGLS